MIPQAAGGSSQKPLSPCRPGLPQAFSTKPSSRAAGPERLTSLLFFVDGFLRLNQLQRHTGGRALAGLLAPNTTLGPLWVYAVGTVPPGMCSTPGGTSPPNTTPGLSDPTRGERPQLGQDWGPRD